MLEIPKSMEDVCSETESTAYSILGKRAMELTLFKDTKSRNEFANAVWTLAIRWSALWHNDDERRYYLILVPSSRIDGCCSKALNSKLLRVTHFCLQTLLPENGLLRFNVRFC